MEYDLHEGKILTLPKLIAKVLTNDNIQFHTKGSSSYHLCVEYFSKNTFDSEMYT